MLKKFLAYGSASALALTVMLSACGDNSSNQSTNVTPNGGTAPAPAPLVVSINIANNASALGAAAFGENPQVVQKGTKCTWVNNDTQPHTVTSTTGAFDSGPIAPGGDFSFTFNDPGTFPIVSTLPGDEGMSGTVEVIDSSASPTPSPIVSPSAEPSPIVSPTPSPVVSPSPTTAPIVVNMPVSIVAGATGRGTNAYSPNPVSVPVGGTVVWTNNDTMAHTVTAMDGSFDSGNLDPGQTFSHTFDSAGSFDYFCSIHGQASMSGTVTVTQ